MKSKIETADVPLPGTSPHSQAIISNGFVFTQGVICLVPETMTLVAGDTDAQMR